MLLPGNIKYISGEKKYGLNEALPDGKHFFVSKIL
jgi:hypothetical protein